MTDRLNALIVVLEKDVREDDIEATRKAIEQIKGVVSVQNNISDINYVVANSRVRQELTEKLFSIIKDFNQ